MQRLKKSHQVLVDLSSALRERAGIPLVARHLAWTLSRAAEIDIAVLITQLTDDLPSPDDVERVRERLAATGWPLDDARDGEETG